MEDQIYSPKSEEEAIYAVLYAIIAADNNVTNEELKQLRQPYLEGFKESNTEKESLELNNELNEIHFRVVKAQKEIGSDKILENSIPFFKNASENNKELLIRMAA